MTKYGRRSRLVVSPCGDNSITPGALGIPHLTALTAIDKIFTLAGKAVRGVKIIASYDPDQATVDQRLPAGRRYLGQVRVRVYKRSHRAQPTELYVDAPLFELPAEAGAKPTCQVLLPEGFDPETGMHVELVEEIARDLAFHSVLALRRRTLVPRSFIEAIAESQVERQWLAMERDRFEVLYLAIDVVYLNKKKRHNRPALQVVACNPAKRIYCTVALIELRKGHEKKAAARLARVLLRLPRPEALLATVTDSEWSERGIVASAVRLAQKRCPALAPLPVLDRFHLQKSFSDDFNDCRIAVCRGLERGKSGRKLKNLPQKVLDAVRDIRSARFVLTRRRWGDILEDKAAETAIRKAFEAAPELKAGFWLLEDLRAVFDQRTLAEAEARFADWKEKLKASGLTCYKKKAKHLNDRWEEVKPYFQVLELLDARYGGNLKIGTNPVESHNAAAKVLWREARCSTIALFELRLLARKGYVAASEAALSVDDDQPAGAGTLAEDTASPDTGCQA